MEPLCGRIKIYAKHQLLKLQVDLEKSKMDPRWALQKYFLKNKGWSLLGLDKVFFWKIYVWSFIGHRKNIFQKYSICKRFSLKIKNLKKFMSGDFPIRPFKNTFKKVIFRTLLGPKTSLLKKSL